MISVYPRDTIGTAGENNELLAELAAFIGTLSGPWVVGGDWNFSPQAMQDTSWPCIVRGKVVAPLLPTCN